MTPANAPARAAVCDRRAFLRMTAGGLAGPLLPNVSAFGADKPALTLQDGDRIALLGNTLIEREQQYGYWEAALTRRHPQLNLTFRDLGWSGDTVTGIARAAFDPPPVGFQRLKEMTFAVKPTVLIIGYGMNESFEGEAGVPAFQKGLDTLLDTLAPLKARTLLLGLPRHENKGQPLPDPAKHNQDLQRYRDVIRQVAEERRHTFLDPIDAIVADELTAISGGLLEKPRQALTDNGIHFNAYGYWWTTPILEEAFGLKDGRFEMTIDAKGEARASGAKVVKLDASPLRWEVTDAFLPRPAAPQGRTEYSRRLGVRALPAGQFALHIDGQSVAAFSAEQWANGVSLDRGPEFDQEAKLRAAIVAKNELFFHRWRPQNQTYLFGFRKHEQGQNAKEIVEFDPLIEQKEAEIAKLRVPVMHTYEMVPVREVKP